MNLMKLIRLFQAKSNIAWEKYLIEKGNAVERHPIESAEWKAAVMRSTIFKTESETWAKAAELLKKEQTK